MIRLGSNLQALNAQRRLGETSGSLAKTYERLSSGQRINRASDDAAGLAIASRLNADTRVFTQGIRNLSDGDSLLNIADGALQQLSSIVVRLQELAEQAANGVYNVKQRKVIDAEAQALSKEYTRIARSTSFNGRNLLQADFGKLSLQAGYGSNATLQSGLGGAIGTGEFAPAQNYYFGGASEFAPEVADLNGDGLLDVATNVVGGSIGVRLNLGNGSFGSVTSYAHGLVSSFSLDLGDINNDGIQDMATTGYNGTQGVVSLRLGLGNGTFGSATSYTMETLNSFAVELADLNNDGALDLISAGTSTAVVGSATIRLGQGNGTFGAAISFVQDVPNFIFEGLDLGDINNDGILDLVTAGNSGAAGRATVRLGNGDGSFRTGTAYATEAFSSSNCKLGDFNGDGNLDLLTAGDDSVSPYLTLRLGTGTGTFGAARSFGSSYTGGFYALAVGDINGDGALDAYAAGVDGSQYGPSSIFLGTGTGSFNATHTLNTSIFTFGAALGDVSGDGVLDLISAAYDTGVAGGLMSVQFGSTTDGVSPLLEFKLTSRADALTALSQFDGAQRRLASQRGVIGAFQARISYATSTLQAATENFAAAASRIQDTDVAAEAANLTRQQILQQAAAAVLGQANQLPALALKLLNSS